MPGPFAEFRREIDALRRRLHVLETVPRQPHLTVGGERGIQVVTVAALELLAGAGWADLATFGPQATVQVTGTGILRVTLSCVVSASGTGADAAAGFHVSGPGGYVLQPNELRSLRTNSYLSGSLVKPLTGLVPGEYVVTMKYWKANADSAASFMERSLICEP